MLAALFAILFGLSLLPGRKPLCLRFAERISAGIMPDGAEAYCRRLTWIWFLILCGVTSVDMTVLLRACLGETDPAAKSAAAGFAAIVSFAAIATAFAVERTIRNRRFKVVFHTSGSTGSSKTIVKTFESLAKEVAMHRAHYWDRFGKDAADGLVFLGTVQWNHMYGKLWMDMLPKAMGAKADPDVIRTPEELIAKMRAAKRVVLVTTPSFVERIAAYADQYDVPRNCVEVVTSGALLTKKVSDLAERVFGIAPRQIFGSTETGGIADRRFPCESFAVFGPVRISENGGRIEVRSPFAFRKRYVMGDGADIAPDGRSFILKGRLDRLVKINEERVNLAEMEDKVRALGFADCALAKMPGKRGDFLGCVLVEDSRGRLSALELRKLMLPEFPKGTVPKRFRFVDRLPRNAQGKILAAEVVAMLEHVEIPLRFTGDEHFFQGHFPGAPILPGVVQLGLAVENAKKAYGFDGALKMAKKLKFVHIIEPGHDIVLSLSKSGDGEVKYEFSEGGALCSSGTLVF